MRFSFREINLHYILYTKVMKNMFMIKMLENYNWLTKGDEIYCFLEKEDWYMFEYAWEYDTQPWFIPKEKAKKIFNNIYALSIDWDYTCLIVATSSSKAKNFYFRKVRDIDESFQYYSARKIKYSQSYIDLYCWNCIKPKIVSDDILDT